MYLGFSHLQIHRGEGSLHVKVPGCAAEQIDGLVQPNGGSLQEESEQIVLSQEQLSNFAVTTLGHSVSSNVQNFQNCHSLMLNSLMHNIFRCDACCLFFFSVYIFYSSRIYSSFLTSVQVVHLLSCYLFSVIIFYI